jgi:creatinine amidohydrolase
VLLLSSITIACSHEHGTWPGTASISARTLHLLITGIAQLLEAQGLRKLVLVNAHGGNYVLSNSQPRRAAHVPVPAGP